MLRFFWENLRSDLSLRDALVESAHLEQRCGEKERRTEDGAQSKAACRLPALAI